MTRYYVTVLRGKRVGWLVGPFDTHEAALAHVAPARNEACQIDPRCSFDAFGTTGVTSDGPFPRGVLNERLGL